MDFSLDKIAVSLNQEAVAFMKDGYFDEAAGTFVASFQHVRQLLASIQGCQSLQIPDPDVEKKLKFEFAEVEKRSLPATMVDAHETVFVLFPHFINVTSQIVEGQDMGAECRYRVAMTIMYNSALCLHVQGMRSGKSGSISKAIKHYRCAYGMLEVISGGGGVSDTVLALALLNNLGHAELILANVKEARHCLSSLESALSSLGGLEEIDGEMLGVFSIAVAGCLGSVDTAFSVSPAA